MTDAGGFFVWGREQSVRVFSIHEEVYGVPSNGPLACARKKEMEFSKDHGAYTGDLGDQNSFRKKSNRSAVIQHIQDGRTVQVETSRSSVQTAAGK